MDRSSASRSLIKTRSKKRTLEESVVVDLEKDVVELSAEEFGFEAMKFKGKGKRKGKGKQIMTQDTIDVDNVDILPDMTNKVKLGGNYKGKDLIYISDGEDCDDKKTGYCQKQSLSSMTAGGAGTENDSYLNDLSKASSYPYQDSFSDFFQDNDFEYLPQDWPIVNESSYLQAHFEAANIPTGIEASLPWWLEGQPVNFHGPSISNFSSAQPISGSDHNQMTHSLDNRSVEASCSSTGVSHTNGSISDYGSLPQNHVLCTSFVAAPIKASGGSETPANTEHEDAMRRIQQFDNFAVVDDYSDHHYAIKSFRAQKAWTKSIQDEWKILQSSLPETIFVRAYESNMALLRGVIIGPQGTPYHDGLFFFDVMFPSTYPNAPPLVHYHSGGLRLNPNLYNCGKVCLSLLGTWHGQSASENWIPGKSTMLQVLVSIQALILNSKPYFNEPGYTSYEGSASGEKASDKYNEDTLIKSLRTMLYSMRRPPKHFEELVSDHFITRAHDILLACKAYMDGAQIGSISIVEGKAVRGNNKSCSRALKDNVGMILNSLIDEFAKLGVKNCDGFRVPESKNESQVTSAGNSMSKSQSKNNSKSAKPKISKVKPKESSAYMSALFPTALGVGYPSPSPSPLPLGASSTTAWISPSAVYALPPDASFNLPQPVIMPKVLHKFPAYPHKYSMLKPSNPDIKGIRYK